MFQMGGIGPMLGPGPSFPALQRRQGPLRRGALPPTRPSGSTACWTGAWPQVPYLAGAGAHDRRLRHLALAVALGMAGDRPRGVPERPPLVSSSSPRARASSAATTCRSSATPFRCRHERRASPAHRCSGLRRRWRRMGSRDRIVELAADRAHRRRRGLGLRRAGGCDRQVAAVRDRRRAGPGADRRRPALRSGRAAGGARPYRHAPAAARPTRCARSPASRSAASPRSATSRRCRPRSTPASRRFPRLYAAAGHPHCVFATSLRRASSPHRRHGHGPDRPADRLTRAAGRRYKPSPWRRGRVAEGGGLLNRYRGLNPYRGFESPRLRQQHSDLPP